MFDFLVVLCRDDMEPFLQKSGTFLNGPPQDLKTKPLLSIRE